MKNTLLALALLLVSGCCASNLDAKYVETNEAFLRFIDLEIEAGVYKPDETSRASIEAQRDANAKARAVVEADKGASK